jgi:hypothetical protein
MSKKIILLQILLILLLLGSTASLIGVHYYLTTKRIDRDDSPTPEPVKKFSTSSRKGTFLEAKNVLFRFKKNISLEIPKLYGELVPKENLTIVNFDDVKSFVIKINNGEAYASKEVLEVIFKDYVFNFPDSALKIGNIDFPEEEGSKIKLTGEIHFIFWLEFEMIGLLSLDSTTNTLVISADQITALGISKTKPLLGLVGLSLEKLLPMPKGRGIEIHGNEIIVYPFQIFPPPQMEGKISKVAIKNKKLHLTLDSLEKISLPKPPEPNAKNYLYLNQGDVKFGKLFMTNTNLQMIDKDPSDYLDFYMEQYFKTLTIGGSALVLPDQSLKVIMPDYGDLFP